MASSCTYLEGDDGYSIISGATLEKAQKELREDPMTRGQAVRELRTRILQKEADVRRCSDVVHASFARGGIMWCVCVKVFDWQIVVLYILCCLWGGGVDSH